MSAPRRLAAGAWHVLAGFAFLARRPALWPLALLPAAIAVAVRRTSFASSRSRPRTPASRV